MTVKADSSSVVMIEFKVYVTQNTNGFVSQKRDIALPS
jgi:hypothetical protein